MSSSYEKDLLNLTSHTLSFTPDTVPIGQIVAHSNTDSDRKLEKSMRQLAKRLPFDHGGWPSFTTNVEEHMRVQVRLRSIEILYVERGLGKPVHQGLTFTDAFFRVIWMIAAAYSVEAKQHADRLANQNLKQWLAHASRVKHMYEVNSTFGCRAASNSLLWMCQELVNMQAYETMATAVTAEATLVHALQLGGLPKQMAQDIYREFMPEQVNQQPDQSIVAANHA